MLSRTHQPRQLWDIAGTKGLEMAISLFGEAASQLGSFQSLETELEGESCSVLRLGDRNFRIAYASSKHQRLSAQLANCGFSQHNWLSGITLPIKQLPALSQQATVRPPHRLANLPDNQAVPAQLDGIAVLIWRHVVRSHPTVDIHTATAELNRLIERTDSLSR